MKKSNQKRCLQKTTCRSKTSSEIRITTPNTFVQLFVGNLPDHIQIIELKHEKAKIQLRFPKRKTGISLEQHPHRPLPQTPECPTRTLQAQQPNVLTGHYAKNAGHPGFTNASPGSAKHASVNQISVNMVLLCQ